MALFSKHWFKGPRRHAKLNNQAQKELYKMIKDDLEVNGFNCGGWNTAMINLLIEKKFGIRYNERYLATLLKKMGLSYQKTKFESDRLDSDAHQAKCEQWLDKQLPKIIKKAKKEEAVVLFGDEILFAL